MDRLARAARTGALATATAAAALAGCGLLRPAPPEPHPAGAMAAGLAGCQAGQVDRTTWRVQCGGLVAQVHDPYGEGDSDLLALGEERLTLVGGGAPKAEPAKLPVAGAGRAARRVTLSTRGAPGKVRATGLAALVPFGDSRTRLAWCVEAGADASRCERLLDLLGGLPWRAGPPAKGALPP